MQQAGKKISIIKLHKFSTKKYIFCSDTDKKIITSDSSLAVIFSPCQINITYKGFSVTFFSIGYFPPLNTKTFINVNKILQVWPQMSVLYLE